jgi:hypothetical protein
MPPRDRNNDDDGSSQRPLRRVIRPTHPVPPEREILQEVTQLYRTAALGITPANHRLIAVALQLFGQEVRDTPSVGHSWLPGSDLTVNGALEWVQEALMEYHRAMAAAGEQLPSGTPQLVRQQGVHIRRA